MEASKFHTGAAIRGRYFANATHTEIRTLHFWQGSDLGKTDVKARAA